MNNTYRLKAKSLMLKAILYLLAIIFNFQLSIFNCVSAQTKIVGKNADGTLQSATPYTPHASSVLELESNNRGFLLPRLSTTDRNNISSPATGLTIYNTTTKAIEFHNGTTWIINEGTNAPSWRIGGNATGASDSIIGSTSPTGPKASPLSFWTKGAERMNIDTFGAVRINSTSITPLIIAVDGRNVPEIRTTSSNQASFLRFYRNTYVADGTALGGVDMRNVDQSGSIGAMLLTSRQAYTASSQPTAITFHTTTNNSIIQREVMRIDSSGYVGIGTQNPTAPLHIGNAFAEGRKLVLWERASNRHQYYGLGIEPSTLVNQVDIVGARFMWRAGTSTTTSDTLMTLTGTGRLGIGTTTPTTTLDISSSNTNPVIVTSSVDNVSELRTTSTNTNVGNLIRFHKNNYGSITTGVLGGFDVMNVARNGWLAAIRVNPTQTHALNAQGTALTFWTTADGSNNYRETMRLDQNGNVGIGTNNPQAPLQFASVLGRKIVLHPGGAFLGDNDHQYNGFGIANNLLINQVPTNGQDFIWRAGTSATTSNELMRLTGTGNVGIGTNAPTSNLHISGNTNGMVGALIQNASTGNNAHTILRINNGGSGIDFFLNSPTRLTDGGGNVATLLNNVGALRLQSMGSNGIWVAATTGRVGILNSAPAYPLDVTGDINASGSVRTNTVALTSDIRYKQNITTIPNSLDLIKQIRGTTYNFRTKEFKDKGFDDKKHFGFIAQELEQVIPSVVDTQMDGYKSVNYQEMIPVLLEAIKEQQVMIEELKKKVERIQ